MSPENQDPIPPTFGTLFAKSVKAFAASADSVIAALSTPLTLSENSTSKGANSVNCSPRSTKSLLPVNNDFNPPLLGTEFMNSLMALPAFSAAVTSSSPIEDIVLQKSAIIGPNSDNSSPRSFRLLPPVKKFPILSRNEVAVRAAITATKCPILSTDDSSIFFIPSKNGVSLSIKSLRFSPMSGRLSVNPSTIDPRKLPIHSPTICSTSAPPFINSCNPSILFRDPNNANIPMNSATNAPKPTKPKAALGISGNKALRPAKNNPNPPAATTHFNNASESNDPTASNIAIKASPISLTPSSII